ncbi:MAG: type I restriction-modification system subunit M N-terminal domain-containing protein, partial [Leptospirales bacterium]
MLQSNSALKNKINQLWNKFWSGGISNPLTAIEQITYLLFMKRLDDLDLKNKGDAKLAEKSYSSKFEGYWTPPEHVFKLDEKKAKSVALKEKAAKEKPYRIKRETLRWSIFKDMPPEEMLSHVQIKVFPFLKDLNGDESPFTQHMKNAVFIIHKPALLVDAIQIIQEIIAEIEKD